eukprot:884029-Pleurochrysis_carterae.AAC.1
MIDEFADKVDTGVETSATPAVESLDGNQIPYRVWLWDTRASITSWKRLAKITPTRYLGKHRPNLARQKELGRDGKKPKILVRVKPKFISSLLPGTAVP